MRYLRIISDRLLITKELIIVIFPPFWKGLSLCLLFFLASCNDMKDIPRPENKTITNDPTQLFVLCEGLFNMNNSTLAKFELKNGEFTSDYFLQTNHRSLGDTGNDMALYGSKLYVVMNVSSQIEVIDASSGKSIKRIAMFNEKGISRQPRYIAFEADKAYICSYDGSLCKIDTTLLQIEDVLFCGKNPDGMCIANNKIYVSNSGGLNFPNYDNTVSVIDIETFTEIKKITVGINPGKILADSEGDVYLISRGNYGLVSNKLQKINSVLDELSTNFNAISGLNFTIHNDTAYIYNFDFKNNASWIGVFDCKKEIVISNQFISDGTIIDTPFGIDVNPMNGDVYITDAKQYTVFGDVSCFDNKGKLKYKIQEIGMNPSKVVFIGSN